MMSHSTCEQDLNAQLAMKQIQESLRSGFQLSPEIALSLMCTSMNSAVFNFIALQIEHSKVFDESELVFYLPQIVQALRFEVLLRHSSEHNKVDAGVRNSINTPIGNNSSTSMIRKISMASVNEDEEDYLPAFTMSRSMSSSTLFLEDTPSPLAMALISRSMRSSIVASKLMWLLNVEMVSELSSDEKPTSKKKGKRFESNTFSKSFTEQRSSLTSSSSGSLTPGKELHPSVIKILQQQSDSPVAERSSFSEIRRDASLVDGKLSSISMERRTREYYALCHATLIEQVSSVSKIEHSLHGQTILMDRLFVINRYISSSEGGKDTSAKGAELRRIVLEASKKRRLAESQVFEEEERIQPHLDAKMLVSPLYPKMSLTRVLPNACTVFKSALRPMLMRFEVKIASTFSLNDLLGDGTMTSSITRNDCVATRVRKRLSQLVHSKPSTWIVQDLESAMSTRGDSSTMIEVKRSRWIAMIDAVCSQIVKTYITSESPVTENLWTQKQRAAVAKELHIDEENVEHLFKFICAQANYRRHTSRFMLGSKKNSTSIEEEEEEKKKKKGCETKSDDDVETGGTRIGQISLTLDACLALGRRVLMCGPMWKNKPSIMGSGSQIMRQVWLRAGHLAYVFLSVALHFEHSII